MGSRMIWILFGVLTVGWAVLFDGTLWHGHLDLRLESFQLFFAALVIGACAALATMYVLELVLDVVRGYLPRRKA